jgi:hypothetical protein
MALASPTESFTEAILGATDATKVAALDALRRANGWAASTGSREIASADTHVEVGSGR